MLLCTPLRRSLDKIGGQLTGRLFCSLSLLSQCLIEFAVLQHPLLYPSSYLYGVVDLWTFPPPSMSLGRLSCLGQLSVNVHLRLDTFP